MVVSQIVRCTNQFHKEDHSVYVGKPPDRPDCTLEATGTYVIAHGFGEVSFADEHELVADPLIPPTPVVP